MMTSRTVTGWTSIHLAIAIAAVAGEPTYTYYDLGSLGLPVSNFAHDINDLGIVGGESHRSGVQSASAYTWDNGLMTDHTDSIPNGWLAVITGVSEKGSMIAGALQEEAVLWLNGVGFILDVPDGCQRNEDAVSINAAGTLAVGQCQEEDGYDNIPAVYFLDSKSGLALGFLADAPDDAVGWAEDVNDTAVVVGWFNDGRAFFWQDGEMAEIPNLLGGTSITAQAINNPGLIVGNASNTPNGNVATSYDLNTGIMMDLGFGTPLDVNELGHAVGESGTRAYLYQNGEAVNLHDLSIGRTLSWSIATAINNYGWIAGFGADGDGDFHGWLLVPIYDKGDYDGDGDVDHQDFANFQRCFAAEDYIDSTLHVGCSVFDFDDDVDLDLTDYAAFQSAFTGPTAPNLNPNGPG